MQSAAKKIMAPNGPKCFFDMTADGKPLGRIVIGLHADVCPRTCGKLIFFLLCKMKAYWIKGI